MKKILLSLSVVSAFLVCTLFSLNAYAATDITAAVVTPEKTSYTYTGSAIKPEVKVTLGDEVLGEENYDVTYSKNKNAGTAEITVTAKGEYTGSAKGAFEIAPLAVSSSGFTFENTNKAKPNTPPKYTLKYKKTTLKEGTDYTFTVKNGNITGYNKASVTFKGKGNFKGSKTVKCDIYPEKTENLTIVSRKNTSANIAWDSQSEYEVTGYKIYKCKSDGTGSKLYKTVKSDNTAGVYSLNAGKANYVKVRAYKTNSDKTLYGAYSPVLKIVTVPNVVTINSVAKSKDKSKLVVRWNSVSGWGYQIKYSTDKTFKTGVNVVKVQGASKNAYSINIPVSNSKYYARVQSVSKDGGTYYFAPWSAVVSSNFSKLYSSYTTYYTGSANRKSNIRNAVKRINGTVLKPGETFSFDKVVGKRTKARGFKEAPVFVGQKGHALGLGGGVCQVGTTVFNAALVGNFQIVERHQHSQRVGYIAAGRDAAIDWGSKNVRFKNNTPYPMKIKAYTKNSRIYIKIYTRR
ncbi:MAG: VanW family protein [Eubacterium sp.]|nr:VanW family protein [Eubacterium sp.]